MKENRNAVLSLLLAAGLLTGLAGCSKTEDSSSTASEESAQEESSAIVTDSNPADMNYQLTYDSEKIPDGLAETIAMYFYAIDTQNYSLYLEQINPVYQEYMENMLQEQYGYGLETSMEQYHQTLTNYAGTEDYTITGIELGQAEEVLAEDFEENTDFVAEYLDLYSGVFGDGFEEDFKEKTDAIYDVAVTMTGTDGDGNTLTIFDGLEILAAETDGTYGVLG